jgi:hypothetical protein
MNVAQYISSTKAHMARLAVAVNSEPDRDKNAILLQQFQYLSMCAEFAEQRNELPPFVE